MDPPSSRKMASFSSPAAEAVSDTARPPRAWGKEKASQQTGDDRFRTFREDVKTRSLNLMAAAAPNIEDLKVRRSNGGLKKPSYDIDVDNSAEEFIQRFRENLKIERKQSLEDYQAMLKRGV